MMASEAGDASFPSPPMRMAPKAPSSSTSQHRGPHLPTQSVSAESASSAQQLPPPVFSAFLMNDIPRGTSRAKLTRFLLGQSPGPSRLHHQQSPQVVFGCAISNSRLDDELCVATIEFSDTPPWLLSQDLSGFPKHTQLGTIWPGVDRVATDAHGKTEFIRAVLDRQSRFSMFYVEMLAEFPDTNVNIQDEQGRTALHWACAESLTEMAGLCLSIPDMDTGLRDNENLTAFDIALRTGSDTLPGLFYTSLIEIEQDMPQVALLRVLTLSSDESSSADKSLFPGEALFEPIGDRNSPLVLALLDRGVELTTKDEAGNTALHVAAGLKDNVEVVTRMVEAGADINAVGNGGATPLHSAVSTADAEMVQLLVDLNADTRRTDKDNMTALDRAVKIGNSEVERVLAREAADSVSRERLGHVPIQMTRDSRNIENVGPVEPTIIHRFERAQEVPILPKSYPPNTSLSEAAENGDLDRVRALLAGGAKIGAEGGYRKRPLHYAAENGHTEIVKELLAAGAEIEVEDCFDQRPLHYATQNRHTEIVKELLAAGAEIEAHGHDRKRPLHYAAENGHTEIVKELLAAGAEIEAEGYNCNRPLHHAAWNGHTEIVKELLEAGAEIEAGDNNGWRPLHRAARHGHTEIVKELLAAGAEIEAGDKDGKRPLHCAALNGHTEIVKELLAAGAEIEAGDNGDSRPLHYAAQNGHTETVKELLAAGAKTEAVDSNCWRPLHRATRPGHTEIVKELLAAGAEIEAGDNHDWRPLHYAARFGRTETVKELLAAGAQSQAVTSKGKTPYQLAAKAGRRGVLEILRPHTSGKDILESRVRAAFRFL